MIVYWMLGWIAWVFLLNTDRVSAQGPLARAWTGEISLQWEYKAEEAIESSPAIGKRAIYVADAMGQVYAVDRSSGKEIWKRDFETGFLAAPAIAPSPVSPHSAPPKIHQRES